MEKHQPAASARPPEPLPACGAERPRVLASSDLLQGERVLEIHHNGEIYRLQATRLGKLILTK